jgi:hypothetical protein
MHHDLNNLYATKAEAIGSYSPSGHVEWSRLASAIQSRGPWLSGALCCRSRSSLTMASSETLALSYRFMDYYDRSLPYGLVWAEGERLPNLLRLSLSTVPPSVPRWTRGVSIAVPSSSAMAFAISAQARHPHAHARRFPRGKCNEAAKFTLCYGPVELIALHRQGRLPSSFHRIESPQPDVEYIYAGKQPIPAAGLSPARHAALWAANGATENTEKKMDISGLFRSMTGTNPKASGPIGSRLEIKNCTAPARIVLFSRSSRLWQDRLKNISPSVTSVPW